MNNFVFKIQIFRVVCISVMMSNQTIGQVTNHKSLTESILDSVTIKSDIMSFNYLSKYHCDPLSKPKVSEIKMKSCTNNKIIFNKGSVIANEIYVSIFGNNVNDDTKISRIRLIFYKFPVDVPQSEFEDISNVVFCINDYDSDKVKAMSNFKLFKSLSKEKRYYLYYLNGAQKLEVIWIFENWKYYGRIVEYL